MKKQKTGWWNPSPYHPRIKFHYVSRDGRSLCGKWLYVGLGILEEGMDEHVDNCLACEKKKAVLNQKETHDED